MVAGSTPGTIGVTTVGGRAGGGSWMVICLGGGSRDIGNGKGFAGSYSPSSSSLLTVSIKSDVIEGGCNVGCGGGA